MHSSKQNSTHYMSKKNNISYPKNTVEVFYATFVSKKCGKLK